MCSLGTQKVRPFDKQISVYSKVEKPSAQVFNCANTCANAKVHKYLRNKVLAQVIARVGKYMRKCVSAQVRKCASTAQVHKYSSAQVSKYLRKYLRKCSSICASVQIAYLRK